MVIWIRNGIMVIENFCGDRYLWDPGVLVQFSAAIKPMVISIFPPEKAERIREHKTKFDSVRRKLAATSKPTVNTKKHKHTDGLGLFKNRESWENTALYRALGRLGIYVVGLQYRAICNRKTEHRKPFLFSGFTSESHCCGEIRRPSQSGALQSHNKFDESLHSVHAVIQQMFIDHLLCARQCDRC